MHKNAEYLYNAWNLQNGIPTLMIFFPGKVILGEIEMAAESLEHQKQGSYYSQQIGNHSLHYDLI